jgi:hypothetical protein
VGVVLVFRSSLPWKLSVPSCCRLTTACRGSAEVSWSVAVYFDSVCVVIVIVWVWMIGVVSCQCARVVVVVGFSSRYVHRVRFHVLSFRRAPAVEASRGVCACWRVQMHWVLLS